MEDDFDLPDGEIRAVSASVHFDGSIIVELAVPGYDDLQVVTIEGNQATLMMTWDHGDGRPVDLERGDHNDARCRELIERHIARLTGDLQWQRARQAYRRQQKQREWEDCHVG